MKILTITRQPQCVRETLPGGEYQIVSRSGLHQAEKLLIEAIGEAVKAPGHFLFAGGRTGAAAMIAADAFPEASVTLHADDAHYANAIYRNLLSNGFFPLAETDPGIEVFGVFENPPNPCGRIRVACTSSLPEREFDAAFITLTDGAQSTEKVQELLEETASRLRPGGTLIITGNKAGESFLKQVKARFAGIAFTKLKKDFFILHAAGLGAPTRPRDFTAAFEAGLPPAADGTAFTPLTFITRPGVFCHRRADAGGLALAEVAAQSGAIAPGATIVDMGCGCGMVGILALRAAPGATLVAVDSSPRALAVTAQNLAAAGLTARLILSSTGMPGSAFADIYLANPPYFSDYTIAERFLATAFQALKPKGRLFFVAKAAEKPREMMFRLRFRRVIPAERRGYTVLQAER